MTPTAIDSIMALVLTGNTFALVGLAWRGSAAFTRVVESVKNLTHSVENAVAEIRQLRLTRDDHMQALAGIREWKESVEARLRALGA